MFDIGWSEFLVIGVVALVVIGPKDLPKALRALGFWVRKARTMSREFQSSVEQMMREAELDEVKKEVEKAAAIDLDKEFKNTIDPTGSLEEALKPPELPRLDEPARAPTTPALTEPPPPAEIAPPAETTTAAPPPAPEAEPSAPSKPGAAA
jgi:sec-independent protein translocase protein TatB